MIVVGCLTLGSVAKDELQETHCLRNGEGERAGYASVELGREKQ
jgi:hypothetical protein